MQIYISTVCWQFLLLDDKQRPFLETMIVSRPEFLVCIKERVLDKLVRLQLF